MRRPITGPASLLLLALPLLANADCADPATVHAPFAGADCALLETVTIFGTAQSARNVAGGASIVTAEELDAMGTTDVERALRRVPGLSLQVEDGWAGGRAEPLGPAFFRCSVLITLGRPQGTACQWVKPRGDLMAEVC